VVGSGCGVTFLCGPGGQNNRDVHACVDGNLILKFSHRPAFGFCPHETDLFSALVVADEDGAYSFCGTELVEAPDWCPNCVRAVPGPSSCLVELPLARRILTAQQAHQLDGLLV